MRVNRSSNYGRMCWVGSKLIRQEINLGSSFLGATTSAILSKGNSPKFGWNRSGVALLSRKLAMSLKRGKIGPTLLLMTNRKLHAHFRLVQNSVTLNNFEQPLYTLFQKSKYTRFNIVIQYYLAARRLFADPNILE